MEEAAQYLAEVNHEYAPEIKRTYRFPDPAGKQIRLIHVSPNAFGNDGNPAVRPFSRRSVRLRNNARQTWDWES